MRLSPALAALAVVSATACAPGATSTAPPAVTVTATVTASPSAGLSSEPTTASPSRRTPSTNTPGTKTSGRLPDVTGMNLQAAQDMLQAQGFYVLDDQDATGQNRLQVFDRNWVVVRQTPAAGKRVPTTTKVVLYAKKRGE
jgi:beta-lactam-binding protein with PASTA domain